MASELSDIQETSRRSACCACARKRRADGGAVLGGRPVAVQRDQLNLSSLMPDLPRQAQPCWQARNSRSVGTVEGDGGISSARAGAGFGARHVRGAAYPATDAAGAGRPGRR